MCTYHNIYFFSAIILHPAHITRLKMFCQSVQHFKLHNLTFKFPANLMVTFIDMLVRYNFESSAYVMLCEQFFST